jgi:hypothetical protein
LKLHHSNKKKKCLKHDQSNPQKTVWNLIIQIKNKYIANKKNYDIQVMLMKEDWHPYQANEKNIDDSIMHMKTKNKQKIKNISM